jgi:hypothetical protein
VSILVISLCTPLACRERSHQDIRTERLLAKFVLREGQILHAIALCCKGRHTMINIDVTCTAARIAQISPSPYTTVGFEEAKPSRLFIRRRKLDTSQSKVLISNAWGDMVVECYDQTFSTLCMAHTDHRTSFSKGESSIRARPTPQLTEIPSRLSISLMHFLASI